MNTEEALSGPEMGAVILSNYRMLSAESDRGAVLLASSIIERGLTELICAFLLETDKTSAIVSAEKQSSKEVSTFIGALRLLQNKS